MDYVVFMLSFAQVFGATVGAFSSIWSEISYVRAMKDGILDAAEREHMHALAQGLRFGMTLLLAASFGLVITAYLNAVAVQPALTASYWTLVALALLITAVSWALSRHRIAFPLGSAAVFTGWWFLVYLTIGLLPQLSFGAAVAFFVVATGVFYGILQYLRFLALRKK